MHDLVVRNLRAIDRAIAERAFSSQIVRDRGVKLIPADVNKSYLFIYSSIMPRCQCDNGAARKMRDRPSRESKRDVADCWAIGLNVSSSFNAWVSLSVIAMFVFFFFSNTITMFPRLLAISRLGNGHNWNINNQSSLISRARHYADFGTWSPSSAAALEGVCNLHKRYVTKFITNFLAFALYMIYRFLRKDITRCTSFAFRDRNVYYIIRRRALDWSLFLCGSVLFWDCPVNWMSLQI